MGHHRQLDVLIPRPSGQYYTASPKNFCLNEQLPPIFIFAFSPALANSMLSAYIMGMPKLAKHPAGERKAVLFV